MAKLKSHRPLRAHVAAVLRKGMADFSDRAHPVVRHAVDHDGRTADAVTLVTNFFVVDTLQIAGGLVNIALDVVGWHIGRLGLVDGQAQARIHVDVAAARAGRDDDFTGDPGPDLAAFFVLTTLAVLDIRPFAVSGH